MKTIQKHHLYKAICVCICLFAQVMGVFGQEKTDTIRVHTLQEVDVKGEKRPATTRSTSPVQVLKREEIEKLHALQVSDAVKFFSGVQVKDYGGVGGLKTVSVRSLGANHTAVAYDGVVLSNYQTGQLDLGRLSLENVEMLSLYIGGDDDIFQSARIQSSVSALNIMSKKPQMNSEKKTAIGASLGSGSFGLFHPFVCYSQILNKAFSVGTSGEWLHTDGNYPYTSGSGEQKKRKHSEVENLKLETNLWGNFNNGGQLSFKIYGYNTERSLPGPDIYYTNSPGELLHDKQFLSQVGYEQAISGKIKFRSVIKFDISNIHYTSLNRSYASGEKKSVYDQREYYASNTFLYTVFPSLSVSWANDGSFANFKNEVGTTSPSRTIWQSALSSRYYRPQFSATAMLIGTYVHDEIKMRKFSEETFDLSPYFGFSVQPLKHIPLRMRGFYKETFRQPTFADMYAAFVPTQNLKPEKADQLDFGLSYTGALSGLFPYLSVTVDAYWNKIDNKIVSYPTNNMFLWSVQNLDKVDVRGIDINSKLQIRPGENVLCQLGGSYTYQNVLDKTDPTSLMYNQQIRYTPHHSGSGYLNVSLPWLDVNYTLVYCGERYYERVNRQEYLMKGYADHSFSLSKQLDWKSMKWTVSVEGLNITDRQYEVVRSYPMPGRSFRMKIKLRY